MHRMVLDEDTHDEAEVWSQPEGPRHRGQKHIECEGCGRSVRIRRPQLHLLILLTELLWLGCLPTNSSVASQFANSWKHFHLLNPL